MKFSTFFAPFGGWKANVVSSGFRLICQSLKVWFSSTFWFFKAPSGIWATSFARSTQTRRMSGSPSAATHNSQSN